MNAETRVKNSIMRKLKQTYPGIFLWKISDTFRSGVPDLLCIYQGRHIFIEIKTPKGIVSPIQRYTMNEINKAGGEAYVCMGADEALDIFTSICYSCGRNKGCPDTDRDTVTMECDYYASSNKR